MKRHISPVVYILFTIINIYTIDRKSHYSITHPSPHVSLKSLQYICLKTILLNIHEQFIYSKVKQVTNTLWYKLQKMFFTPIDQFGNHLLHYYICDGNLSGIKIAHTLFHMPLYAINNIGISTRYLAHILKKPAIESFLSTSESSTQETQFCRQSTAEQWQTLAQEHENIFNILIDKSTNNLISYLNKAKENNNMPPLEQLLFFSATMNQKDMTTAILKKYDLLSILASTIDDTKLLQLVRQTLKLDSVDILKIHKKIFMQTWLYKELHILSTQGYCVPTCLRYVLQRLTDNSFKNKCQDQANFSYLKNNFISIAATICCPELFKKYRNYANNNHDYKPAHNINPLLIASLHGNKPLVSWLLKDDKTNTQILQNGQLPIHVAEKKSIIKKLIKNNPECINMQDSTNYTPLATACETNNLHKARILLEHNADVTIVTQEGNTALHVLCNNEYSPSMTILDALLFHNININAQNKDGATALHYACKHGHTEIVKKLIESGAHITTKDNSGLSPTDIARINTLIEHIITNATQEKNKPI